MGGNNNEQPIRPAAINLNAGDRVGGAQFTLIRRLSPVGASIVWLALDERAGEAVALKFIPPEIAADEVSLDDLRRETNKCRHLDHPRIICIRDLIETPGEPPFISLEYVDGTNLSSLRLGRSQRSLDWDFLTPLFGQLCEALIYAHGQNVMHRDLRPANLIVDAKGGLKVADFGIASTMTDSLSRLSPREAATGMMVYMSPQQLNGDKPAVTDDIYSLGATLYELLCSRPPFYGGDIPHQIRNVAPVPPGERLAELALKNPVPDAVSALIMACLAKAPAQRPQSVQVIAEWLGCVSPEATPLSSTEPTHAAISEVASPSVEVMEVQAAAVPESLPPIVEPTAPAELVEVLEPVEPVVVIKPRRTKLIIGVTMLTILVLANVILFWIAREKSAAVSGKSAANQTDQWIKLFDGQSTAAWVGEDGSEFPVTTWKFDGDLLETIPNGGKVALFTREAYRDFELEFDWRMGAGGNSGILYGPRPDTQARREFQLVDDDGLKAQGGKPAAPENRTGAFWGIIPPMKGFAPLPVGQWNHGKLVVHGTHVEHWINGQKIVEYEMDSAETAKKFAAAKKKYAGTLKKADPDFLQSVDVAIGLQAMSGEVAFRNIRLRKLAGEARN